MANFDIKGRNYVSIKEARKKAAATENNSENKNVISAYVHKEHKFQLQAFLMRVMKKEKMGTIGTLTKITQDKFMSIKVEADAVEKCMQELIDKEFISLSNDVYQYIA